MDIKLLAIAVACFICSIFAVCGTAKTVPWTTVTVEVPRDDWDISITLYKFYRSGDDDDVTQIDDDDFRNYKAFQLNRGVTVIAFIHFFLIGALYTFLAIRDKRIKAAEIASGVVVLFVSFFSFVGSGYWIQRMRHNYFYDNDITEDKVKCAAGCALELTNAFISFLLGICMIAFAVGLKPGALPKPKMPGHATTGSNNA